MPSQEAKPNSVMISPSLSSLTGMLAWSLASLCLCLLGKEEVYTLYLYLEQHRFKFLGADGRATMSNNRQLKPKQMVAPQESKLSDRLLIIIARQSTTHQIEENKDYLYCKLKTHASVLSVRDTKPGNYYHSYRWRWKEGCLWYASYRPTFRIDTHVS